MRLKTFKSAKICIARTYAEVMRRLCGGSCSAVAAKTIPYAEVRGPGFSARCPVGTLDDCTEPGVWGLATKANSLGL